MKKKVKKITLARYLYREHSIGAEYLVKNKDGECYLVDHGNCGLIKTSEQWEDAEYGFDENVFQPSKYEFDVISWEDSEPLSIWDYLKRNGWINENGEFAG